MQISQTPRQYSKFERKYYKHQGRHHHFVQLVSSTGFSTYTEKFFLPPAIRVKAEGNIHRCVKLLLLFLVLAKETRKIYQAQRKR